jgi:hypothetical protein
VLSGCIELFRASDVAGSSQVGLTIVIDTSICGPENFVEVFNRIAKCMFLD